jgi:transposase
LRVPSAFDNLLEGEESTNNRPSLFFDNSAESPLVPFQRFAKGLRDDYDVVKAGVTLSWSTSPVEGHINRLKMLKRQMFGRARLDLLSRRFVLAV